MGNAMIAGIAMCVGTVILLAEALIDRSGGPAYRVEKVVHTWLPPFGWAALVCSSIFAMLAAGE